MGTHSALFTRLYNWRVACMRRSLGTGGVRIARIGLPHRHWSVFELGSFGRKGCRVRVLWVFIRLLCVSWVNLQWWGNVDWVHLPASGGGWSVLGWYAPWFYLCCVFRHFGWAGCRNFALMAAVYFRRLLVQFGGGLSDLFRCCVVGRSTSLVGFFLGGGSCILLIGLLRNSENYHNSIWFMIKKSHCLSHRLV